MTTTKTSTAKPEATTTPEVSNESVTDTRVGWPIFYSVIAGGVVTMLGAYTLVGASWIMVIAWIVAAAILWLLYLLGSYLNTGERAKKRKAAHIPPSTLNHTEAKRAWLSALAIGAAGFIGVLIGALTGPVIPEMLASLTASLGSFKIIVPLAALAVIVTATCGSLLVIAYGANSMVRIIGLVLIAVVMTGITQQEAAPRKDSSSTTQEELDVCEEPGAEVLYLECQKG